MEHRAPRYECGRRFARAAVQEREAPTDRAAVVRAVSPHTVWCLLGDAATYNPLERLRTRCNAPRALQRRERCERALPFFFFLVCADPLCAAPALYGFVVLKYPPDPWRLSA